MQIAHDGRQSYTDLSDGAAPIAPSVVPFEGQAPTSNGWVPVSPHRALETDEIPMLVESFRKAARRAKKAGFDGIEMHSANGYLADTLLQDGTNRRTDRYGGSLENRTRFSLELVEALISVWDADKVGVRISPSGQWGRISDSDPEATFGYFANALNNYPLAYLHIIEPRVKGVETIDEHQAPVSVSTLRKIYKGVLLAAGGFDRTGAEAILQRARRDRLILRRIYSRCKPNFARGNIRARSKSPPVQPYRARLSIFIHLIWFRLSIGALHPISLGCSYHLQNTLFDLGQYLAVSSWPEQYCIRGPCRKGHVSAAVDKHESPR
jgi:N-ethylmaleimide reductase